VFPTGVLGGGGGGGPEDRIHNANGSISSFGARANELKSPGKAVSSPDKGELEKRDHSSNGIAFSYVPIVERDPAPSWSEHLI
jgi:hypothetical protein